MLGRTPETKLFNLLRTVETFCGATAPVQAATPRQPSGGTSFYATALGSLLSVPTAAVLSPTSLLCMSRPLPEPFLCLDGRCRSAASFYLDDCDIH